MQRTVLLYAVAIATLVGAFLLSPKVAEAPEPPPPLPPPPAPVAEPVTHLTFADDLLRVDARLDRGLLLHDEHGLAAEPVFLDVALRATDAALRRPTVATLLVIDRSGSMTGAPIDHARRAAKSLVSRLEDGDRLALVSYGTDVTVDLPWTTLDDSSRARATRSIDALLEGGGTNVDGALKRARAMVTSLEGFDGVVRVVLLSDGRANEGERRVDRLSLHAEALRTAGATLSTLGLGLDYNEELLERLATVGSGRYHYLRHAKDLGAILDDELQHATRVVARGVRLVLSPDPRGLELVAAPGATLERSTHGTAVVVGDLAAGEERRVLLELRPGAKVDAARGLTWLAPLATYTRASDGELRALANRADAFRMLSSDDRLAVERSRDDAVRVRVLQVSSSLALTESMEAYAKGDVATARRVLDENRARLKAAAKETKSAVLHDEAAQLDSVLSQVEAAPPSSTAAQDMVKYQRARAFGLRR